MAFNNVSLVYSYFADPEKSQAISEGDAYVGNPDTDPEIGGNQKQVYHRQENGSDVPVSQPLQTGAGGVILINGSPAQIVVDGNYSIKVLDKSGVQKYYDPNRYDGEPVTVDSILSVGLGGLKTIAELRDYSVANLTGDERIYIAGYYKSGDGGGGPYYWDAASTDVDDGGITILPDGHTGAGRWKLIIISDLSVKQYGAKGAGTTDDTATIKAAVATGLPIYVPATSDYYRVVDSIPLLNGQTIYGDGFYSTIKLVSASGSGQVIGRIGTSVDPAKEITIKGLHIDASDLQDENGVGFAYGIGTITTECFFSNIGNKAWTVQVGCIGNIFTDSTIVSAQTAASAISGAFAIEGASGDVNSTGNIASNIHIESTGNTAVQIFNASYNKIDNITVSGEITSRLAFIVGESGFNCVGNTIDGINSDGPTNRAVDFLYAKDNTIQNVTAADCTGTAVVYGADTTRNRVSGGIIKTTAAIAVTASPTTATRNITENLEITAATDCCALVGEENEVKNCVLIGPRGLNIGAPRTKVIGNIIEPTSSYSITLAADGCLIQGNQFGAAGVGGINLQGKDSLITLNTSLNATATSGEAEANTIYHNSWDPTVIVRTVAPTTGTWVQGDIAYNQAPSASGTIGWVCVTSGVPGTWKTWGNIAA